MVGGRRWEVGGRNLSIEDDTSNLPYEYDNHLTDNCHPAPCAKYFELHLKHLLGNCQPDPLFSFVIIISINMNDHDAFAIAVEEAKLGYKEGGVPVFAPLSFSFWDLILIGFDRLVQL